jgi:hypothetical protein
LIIKTLFQTNKINKMKSKSTIIKAFAVRALLVFSITIGFASFIKCNALSITGKWKVMSIKLFLNAGNPVEHPIPPTDIHEFEFKPDHTYMVTDGPGSTSTGTWLVSGNQLTMVAPAEQRK